MSSQSCPPPAPREHGRAAPIDEEAYFPACCRYIELNPVRARMVRHPRDYRWSSYRAHAQGADQHSAS